MELDAVDGMKRCQHIPDASAGGGILGKYLHIVEPIEAHDVRDRLADLLRVACVEVDSLEDQCQPPRMERVPGDIGRIDRDPIRMAEQEAG